LSIFVADAVRFLEANFSVVAEAPLQIYSCLAFVPSETVVRRTFEHAIPRWISNLPKVEENWDACLLTLEGHSDWVKSVVFSHNSKKVASGSGDKTIRIWNAETGECERELKGHSSCVNSIVFSNDSKKVASASLDKTIRIWNAETGECERVLEGHSESVRSMVFSHDSKKVASGSSDKTIRIWDAETGECERVLEGHSHWVKSVVFSHDSKKVASGSDDKTIRIWNADTGVCEDVVPLDGYAHVVSFTSDERGIVTDCGLFLLPGGSPSRADSAISWQPSEDPILACIDNTWVTAAEKDLLWLPPECRNGEAAVLGNTVVIGCRSGRVVLLAISMADVEQWTDT
jgi:WD40 repeat protein